MKTILFLILAGTLAAQTSAPVEKHIAITPENTEAINAAIKAGWIALEISGLPSGGYEIVMAPPPPDQAKAQELLAEITRRAELKKKREALQNPTPPTK